MMKLFKITLAFALCSLVVIGMLSARILYTESIVFTFLVWNLFLAWVPYICAIGMTMLNARYSRSRLYALPLSILSIIWLLTLPNAPYIVTDLMHLQILGGKYDAPLWFDSLLVSMFSFTGLLLGLASLYLVHSALRQRIASYWAWIITLVAIVLSSFGIYLGRFLRWNSWDTLSAPSELFYDIGVRILSPFDYPRTVVFTLGYAACLIAFYLVLYFLIGLGKENKK